MILVGKTRIRKRRVLRKKFIECKYEKFSILKQYDCWNLSQYEKLILSAFCRKETKSSRSTCGTYTRRTTTDDTKLLIATVPEKFFSTCRENLWRTVVQ